MRLLSLCLLILISFSFGLGMPTASAQNPAGKNSIQPLAFQVKIDTIMEHDDGKFLWYHPRVAAIPGGASPGRQGVVLTLQKHLHASDHYSGLYVMHSGNGGASWSKPKLPPELDWTRESAKVDVAVADVTPGWHGPTRKIIAVGAQVRYSKTGEQLEDKPRSNQTAFAVYDPAKGTWTPWQQLAMPQLDKFNYARSACSQWCVQDDGGVLLPFYFGPNDHTPFQVMVGRFSFDGQMLKYQRHGNEMALKVVRGLCEPSLIRFQNRYFLTLRNDVKGYVTASADGLNYAPIKPWTFDDGKELGSYNTQQHWLAHSDGLFLVYTRRGANNDHIPRHRAPLFIAQVDPERLVVWRQTERVLIPERGGEMGNFGATAINEHESWVTVSEGVWSADARKRGAKGATLIARIQWARPQK